MISSGPVFGIWLYVAAIFTLEIPKVIWYQLHITHISIEVELLALARFIWMECDLFHPTFQLSALTFELFLCSAGSNLFDTGLNYFFFAAAFLGDGIADLGDDLIKSPLDYILTFISTRRFLLLPSRVILSAIGFWEPRPMAFILESAIPLDTR